MLRILHSVSNMDRAGVETMIMNYYRHMNRELIQFDFWANKAKTGAYEEEIMEMGGLVYRSPGFNPAKFGRYVSNMREVLTKNKDLRIVHAHNGSLGVYALAAAKCCGVENRVYHAHSTRIPPDFKYPYKWLCKKFINRFVTCRLSCGEKAARFFYGHKVWKNGDYTIIHNAIETERFRFDFAKRERAREEEGLSGHFVVGHVGRFSYAKNHERLLSIFAEVKKMRGDAVLLLLGDGENMEKVRSQILSMGLQDSVRMMGNVSDTDRFYQAMDAFVMPSRWEGLPVVGVEAQAAGLNCYFSTAVSSEARVTELARFIDLSATDEQWAEQILDQGRVNAPRMDMSNAIREAGYDIAQEAKKLEALYLKLAKGDAR